MGCLHHDSFPQILHDTLSKACLRISEDERLKMKALFGTTVGGQGRKGISPALLASQTLPCSADGLSNGQVTTLRSALPNRLGGPSHPFCLWISLSQSGH